MRLLIFILIVSLSSCSNKMDDSVCENKLDSVLEISKHFAKTDDTSSLHHAIVFLDDASVCEKTRKSAIEQKIGTLIILRKYEHAILFVDSLDIKDFAYSFQKEMILKNLFALRAGELMDTVNRSRYYSAGISYLENYIRNCKPDSTEFFVAYSDLLFFKEKVLDTIAFNYAVDSLVKAFPGSKKYFNSQKLH